METFLQDENALGQAGVGRGDIGVIGKGASARGGAPGKAAGFTKTPGRKAFGNITNLKGQDPSVKPAPLQAAACVVQTVGPP